MAHFLKLEYVPSWNKTYQHKLGVVRHDQASRIHLIDLVSALLRRSRNSAGNTVREWVNTGVLSGSDWISVNGCRLVSFRLALTLIMKFPGKIAEPTRHEFARVLQLYYAGDSEISLEVLRNRHSQKNISVVAREALKADRAAAAGHYQENASTTGAYDGSPSIFVCKYLRLFYFPCPSLPSSLCPPPSHSMSLTLAPLRVPPTIFPPNPPPSLVFNPCLPSPSHPSALGRVWRQHKRRL